MQEQIVTVINPFTQEPITLTIQLMVLGEITAHGTKLVKVQSMGTFCMNGEPYDPLHDANIGIIQ